jgi:hypothetical protein
MTETVSYRILWLNTKPSFHALIGRRGPAGPFLNVAVETARFRGFVHLIPANPLDGGIAARYSSEDRWGPLRDVWDRSTKLESRRMRNIEDHLKMRYAPERIDIMVGDRWETVTWNRIVLANMTMEVELMTATELKLEEVDRHGHDRTLLAMLCSDRPETEQERFVGAMIDLLRFREFQCGDALADLLIEVLPGKRWAKRDRKFVHVHDRLAQHVADALNGRERARSFITDEFFPRLDERDEGDLREHFAQIQPPQIYVPPVVPVLPVTPVEPVPVGPNVRRGWTVNFPFDDLVRTCLRTLVVWTPVDVRSDGAVMKCLIDRVEYDFVCGKEGRKLSAYDLGELSIVVRAGPGGTGRAQMRLFHSRVVLVKPDGRLLPAGFVKPEASPAPIVEWSESGSSVGLLVRKNRFTSGLPLNVTTTFQPSRRANESQVFALAGLGKERSGACLLLRGSPPDKYILRAIVLFEYSLGIVRR